eukprot:7384814-Prymnesium_polylepis.2
MQLSSKSALCRGGGARGLNRIRRSTGPPAPAAQLATSNTCDVKPSHTRPWPLGATSSRSGSSTRDCRWSGGATSRHRQAGTPGADSWAGAHPAPWFEGCSGVSTHYAWFVW